MLKLKPLTLVASVQLEDRGINFIHTFLLSATLISLKFTHIWVTATMLPVGTTCHLPNEN